MGQVGSQAWAREFLTLEVALAEVKSPGDTPVEALVPLEEVLPANVGLVDKGLPDRPHNEVVCKMWCSVRVEVEKGIETRENCQGDNVSGLQCSHELFLALNTKIEFSANKKLIYV